MKRNRNALEIFEKIVSKSKFTEKDVQEMGLKVDRDMARHFKVSHRNLRRN